MNAGDQAEKKIERQLVAAENKPKPLMQIDPETLLFGEAGELNSN